MLTAYVLTIILIIIAYNQYWLSFFVNTFISNNTILELKFDLTLYSYVFIIRILIISTMVFSWARFYIWGSSNCFFFFILLFLFVISMIFLTGRTRFIFVFLGWEGLGLTSFLLIIFYQNWIRAKGGLLTLLTNRVGDASLIILFGLWLITKGIYNLNQVISIFVSLLFLFVCLTKRAQVPFTSWLPAAIAAPTPVRALVHSSTLVTAGIWLLIRFSQFSIILEYAIFIIGYSTLLVARLAALIELDLKKLIALSTLSQLGLIIIAITIIGPFIRLFHLLIHAFAKANLFLMIGNLIHFRFSHQDARLMSPGPERIRRILSIFIRVFRLRGVAFYSGFFSKEIILNTQYFLFNSTIAIILIIRIITLTVAYCIKLILYRSKVELNQPLVSLRKRALHITPSYVLTIITLLLGFVSRANFIVIIIKSERLSGLYWRFIIITLIIRFLWVYNYYKVNILFYTQSGLIERFNIIYIHMSKVFILTYFNKQTDLTYLFRSIKYSNILLSINIVIILLSINIMIICLF